MNHLTNKQINARGEFMKTANVLVFITLISLSSFAATPEQDGNAALEEVLKKCYKLIEDGHASKDNRAIYTQAYRAHSECLSADLKPIEALPKVASALNYCKKADFKDTMRFVDTEPKAMTSFALGICLNAVIQTRKEN